MRKFNIRQQIGKLYLLTSVGYFQIAGASWVALLAMRGFSLFRNWDVGKYFSYCKLYI